MILYVGGDCLIHGYGLDKKDTWPYQLSKLLKCKELIDDSGNRFSNDTIIRKMLHTLHWYISDSKNTQDEENEWFVVISLTEKTSYDHSINEGYHSNREDKNIPFLPNLGCNVQGLKDSSLVKTVNDFNLITRMRSYEYVDLFFEHVLFLFYFLNSLHIKSIITSTYPIKFNTKQSDMIYNLNETNQSCCFALPPVSKSLYEYMGDNQISKDGYHFNESGHQVITKLMFDKINEIRMETGF